MAMIYNSICKYIDGHTELLKAQAEDYKAVAKTREPYDHEKKKDPINIGFSDKPYNEED